MILKSALNMTSTGVPFEGGGFGGGGMNMEDIFSQFGDIFGSAFGGGFGGFGQVMAGALKGATLEFA